MNCHSERSEESLIKFSWHAMVTIRDCFAEPVLSEAEGLDMTRQSRALTENFTGARGYLDVNCLMVQRTLCVALAFFVTLLPVVAQQPQPHRWTSREHTKSNSVSNAPLSLSLYRSKNPVANDSSFLLHNGSVPLW